MAVGDVFLQSNRGNGNPFTHVRDILSQADIVFANLEAPITATNISEFEKAYSLSIPPENLTFLKDANCSVVNLAHNHILDYGEKGASDSFHYLDEAKIPYIGAGNNISECLKEVVFEIKNVTVSFIGFYLSGLYLSTKKVCVAGTDEQLIRYRISELKKKYDFVIVSLHWGTENVFYPSPEQQAFARVCIDEGASVIIGHHPHRLQGIEKYDGGIIFYSLGNFNFMPCGVGISPYPNLSCIADVELLDNKNINYNLIPIEINNDYWPVPITNNKDRFEVENHISCISEELQKKIAKWWWFGEIARPYLLGNGKSFLIRIRRYGIKHFCQMIRWLCCPFVVKCYIGILLRWLRIGRLIS